MSQTVRTTFLLAFLTVLLLACGQILGGTEGVRIAFVMACIMNFGSYWFSDRIVLAMYRAQPLEETDAPQVYTMVRQLAEKGNLPMPRIYLIPSAAPNAFATGRNPKNAVVAVTQGILELLKPEELQGVLAHELAHVEHRDILTSSIAATIAGAISMLAFSARWSLLLGGGRRRGQAHPLLFILMITLVPLAASLIQLAVSRSREYGADEKGADLCGHPLYLASALRRLDAVSKKIPMRDVQPATAHMFIINPLHGGGFLKLFSTHPPLEERIMKLEKMARARGL